MPKGYWIVNNRVDDAAAYENYKAANAAPLARHGGQFLIRAGQQVAREGSPLPRTVVIEFPSYEAALACYEDADYQAAIKIREAAADGTLLIVEGYDA